MLAQLEDLLSYYPNVQLLEKSVELEQLDEMMYQHWGAINATEDVESEIGLSFYFDMEF